MSHFTVLVIGDDPEEQLAPYHEFECTGENDEYVQDIDRTEEAKEEFANDTKTMLRKIDDGTLTSFFDDQGNWKPQFSKEDERGFMGAERRTYYAPDGYEKVEVPVNQVETFVEWASDYYGAQMVPYGTEPDKDGVHKYGYILVDADGQATKLVKRTNPNKQWDWYALGGRWTGFFTLKDSASGSIGSPGLMTSRAKPGTADAARKGDIDFESMRTEARRKAEEEYDRFAAAMADNPFPLTWAQARKEFPNDTEAARAFYHDQAAYKAVKAAEIDTWGCPFEAYGKSRDAYVKDMENAAGVAFAVVKDGQWHERGSMGWFGCVSDEKNRGEWNEQFAKLIDELPDDTLLSVYDCHI